MPTHDYFGFDERAASQSIDVGSPSRTPWEQFKTFFEVEGVILSEQPDAPAELAASYGEVQGKMRRTADLLDVHAHELRSAWSEGDAAEKYFPLAGATLYGLDQWVEHLDEKIDRLIQLSGDITDAQSEARSLEQEFEAEYRSSIPPAGGYYGFPPDLSKNNPALGDKAEAKLKAQVASAYQRVNAKFLKLIIKLGQKLAQRFIEAAKWVDGSAGKVPAQFAGPDAADPWRPYQLILLDPPPAPATAPAVPPGGAPVTLGLIEPVPGAPFAVRLAPSGSSSGSGASGYRALSGDPLGLGRPTGDHVGQVPGGAPPPGGKSASGGAAGTSLIAGRGAGVGVPLAGAGAKRPPKSPGAGPARGAAAPPAGLLGRLDPGSVPAGEAQPPAMTSRLQPWSDVAAGVDGGPGHPAAGSPQAGADPAVAAAAGVQQMLAGRTAPEPSAASPVGSELGALGAGEGAGKAGATGRVRPRDGGAAGLRLAAQ